MKKVLKVLPVLGLLLFGGGVLFVSVYTASVTGLKGKMGLLGGDATRAVQGNVFARGVYEAGGVPECDFVRAVRPIPRYMLLPAAERIELGWELGRWRIECGTAYILQGNIERGVYTLIKGLYYERSSAQELHWLVEQDEDNCRMFETDRDYGYVEAFLESSEGNARIAVENLYREINDVRGRVAERCIDWGGGKF